MGRQRSKNKLGCGGMKEVCIIVAMLKEAEPIVRQFDSIVEHNVFGRRAFIGRLNGEKLSVIVSGVGKVNAAVCTQIAYDYLSADIIINIGVAGGLNNTVEIGEMYEIYNAVQYDFDLSEVNGTKIGTLDGMYSNYLTFDVTQMDARRLATADRFNDSKEDNVLLTQILDADVRDMEGVAILQACYFNDIECYCYKVISDKFGSGSTVEQYQLNLEKCLKKIGEKIPTILKRVYGKER